MTEHTKEPWKHVALMGTTENGKHDLSHCGLGLRHNSYIREQEANARRIVACVNACSGIPTEKLESIAHAIGDRASELITRAEQRDELIRDVEDFILDHANGLGPDIERLRAAIAKVKP